MNTEDLQTLKVLVRAASLGVSADNGQPWKFRWHDSHLYLHLDPVRATSFFDRRQFAAMFGLGSVLENLVVAATHLGYDADVQTLTRGDNPGAPVLGRVGFKPDPSGGHALYPELERRGTNRRPYDTTPVPAEVQTSLAAPFQSGGALRLLLVDRPEQIQQLGSLVAAADRIRFNFSSPEIHNDFFGCLRFSKQEAETTRDGLWIQCLEVKPLDLLALRLLAVWPVARFARFLGTARIFAQQTQLLLGRTPLVALLVGGTDGTPESTTGRTVPTDDLFLRGGRECQHLWLKATQHNLACQPMAVLPLFFAQHAVFGHGGFPGKEGVVVDRLKTEFYSGFGIRPQEHLLMMLRLGYGPAPSGRAFRRHVDTMFTIDDDSPLVSA